MLSVKGIFKNNVALPSEPVGNREGQKVIITFVEEEAPREVPPSAKADDWEALVKLLKANAIDTGIEDLAHQHDHYLYDIALGKA